MTERGRKDLNSQLSQVAEEAVTLNPQETEKSFPGRPSASAASVLLTLFNSQLSGLNRLTADQNHIFVQQQLHNYEAEKCVCC